MMNKLSKAPECVQGPPHSHIQSQEYRCIQITLKSDNAAYSVDNSQEYKWQN